MKKRNKVLIIFVLLSFVLSIVPNLKAGAQQKPRTIVTTDGEVDDMDSFIRLLLYANEMKLEGLVYSSSMWHYKGDGKGTPFTSEMDMTKRIYGERTELRWCGTTWIQELIGDYGKVYSNLVQHDPGYPTPEYLKSIIRVGNIDFEGEMDKVTEGSEYIKNILLDENDEQVYVQVWGGTNTLARALKSIEEEYKGKAEWKEIQKKVSAKTFIYIILDQDATYKKYIEPNWPEVRTVYNASQFWCLAYAWPQTIPASQLYCLQGKWFSENIRFGHGPLLANYYLWGDGRQITGDPEHTHGNMEEAKKNGREQYDFISEGDSPSFLFLLNFGLQNYSDPSFGGMGGRFVPSGDNPFQWIDGKQVSDYNPESGKADPNYPQARWTKVLQNDFAARADWCVNSYENANHAPLVSVSENTIKAKTGENVKLIGKASDPDKNTLHAKWWNYAEAGTYPGKVDVQPIDEFATQFTVPNDAKTGQTIHMILEVSDDGEPSLARFQRIVIQIK